MSLFNKVKLILFTGFLISGIFSVKPAKALNSSQTFPRLANYYLNFTLTEANAKELSKWDVLILDMEIQRRHEILLKKIRQWNPDIILLAYITPQEIKDDASVGFSLMRRELAGGIKNSWYLKNSVGEKLTWWPGTYLLNITNAEFDKYLVNFVVNKLLSSGLWEGVFYDNAWDGITQFVGSNVDLNQDGVIDVSPDVSWRKSIEYIYNETRRLSGNKYIIVGNGTTRQYLNNLNGKMIENFLPVTWPNTMNTYAYNFGTEQKPVLNIINANTANTGVQNYQRIRFGLTSALLEDGYFSYDYGDQDHGQLWWYDEYGVNLGKPISLASSKNKNSEYASDVWRRDFENGLAIVNSTAGKEVVDLGGEYEKIHGTQDTKTNDGSIVTEIAVDGYDGRVLLKTFSSVDDVLFRNGDFLRFFDSNGDRVRNGFFVFEDGYKGGDKIAHIDLDGNGKRDLLVVHNNRLMAWRDDGQLYMRVYPFTINYRGGLQVAIGDLNGDKLMEIYVAPSDGYLAPIKVYTRHGRSMKRDWYPFGENYTGGYSLAVANIDSGKKSELLIGAGVGVEPKVYLYDYQFYPLANWLAFEKSFRGGINVTGGDVNGDGKDEVIVGAGSGKGPVIRVFDNAGKQLSPEFSAYQTFATPGVEVLSADVDFDGKDDIVGMSGGF